LPQLLPGAYAEETLGSAWFRGTLSNALSHLVRGVERAALRWASALTAVSRGVARTYGRVFARYTWDIAIQRYPKVYSARL